MARILFLGDFFYNYDTISNDIDEISEYIRKNNYKCILNLEGSLYGEIPEKIKKRGPNLYQSKNAIEVLKKLNVIGVTLANNHMMDFGEKGLLETLNILDKNDIKHCGAGTNLENALKPMIFNINEKKIAVYNYGWNIEETVYATSNSSGCSPKEEKYIFNKLNYFDININIMHWGFEYNLYPMPIDIHYAHKMIEEGFDLVIGHHPHVIQSKEIYKNKNIYYSLGNFYFSGRREKFLRKKFPGKIPDKCSYGLGVIYDIEKECVVNEIFIYYDYQEKKSKILHKIKNNKEILTDISDVIYKKNKYLKLVKRNKLNNNPILTENEFYNKIKIKILFLFYSFKKYIKKIIRRK